MNNKLRIIPRPFRLLGYLFWIFCMAAMYIFFRSYLLLTFVAFLSVVPVLSVVVGVFIAKKVSCDISVPSVGYIRPGDDISPVVEVYDPLYIGTLDIRISAEVRNVFFSKENESGSFDVSLPVIGKTGRHRGGRSFLRMPLVATLIGVYRLKLNKVYMQDWFGLVKYEIRFKNEPGKAEFCVLPKVTGGKQPDAETVSVGMTEVEESAKKGNDFSEVTDIREYLPGDRIRDIHWKISARMEEWMVKVRTQMAGMELSVVVVPDTNQKITEYIITYTYQELRTWAALETDIRLMIYTTGPETIRRYTLSSPEDVDEAFKNILSEYYLTHIPEGSDPSQAIDGMIKNLYPYMGGYIRFGMMDDGTIGFMPVEGVSA